MSQPRPHVTVSLACSADGKISTVHREAINFPSRQDREHLFRLRDSVDALVTTAATVRAEDPALIPGPERQKKRLSAGLTPFPMRIIVSRTLDFNHHGRSFRRCQGSQVLAMSTQRAPKERQQSCLEAGIEVELYEGEKVDLKKAFQSLHDNNDIRRILCEGGGILTADLFALGLVDDFWLTLCPLILAGKKSPTPCDGPGFSIAEAPGLNLVNVERWGDEICLHYRPRELSQ